MTSMVTQKTFDFAGDLWEFLLECPQTSPGKNPRGTELNVGGVKTHFICHGRGGLDRDRAEGIRLSGDKKFGARFDSRPEKKRRAYGNRPIIRSKVKMSPNLIIN